MFTPGTKVFEAVDGEGIVSRGFSLHFIDGPLKFQNGKGFICFVQFLDGGGRGVHNVFCPGVVYRDVRFISWRKRVLPVFIYCGFRKLE